MENENADDDGRTLILRKKAESFKEMDLTVHIKYKDGGWKRGKIFLVLSDCFYLKETKEGNCIIFFMEIKNIELKKEGIGKI